MNDIFEYIKRNGNTPFSVTPLNTADSLVFSLLAYIRFNISFKDIITISDAIKNFLVLSDKNERIRVKRDIKFLREIAATKRFGSLKLAFFSEKINYIKETQFGAVSFIIDDDTAFIAFRGTDTALTSWKEDFNMSFKNYVPAQKEAALYLNQVAPHLPPNLILGGHSKGGNIAVFSGVKCEDKIRDRISVIYNHDGPGFSKYVTEDPGYLKLIPKIVTYIPEASIVGMLLEHKGTYTVIRSHNVGLLQHEPYSWKIENSEFVPLKKLSHETEIITDTIKEWLKKMPQKERKEFVDAVFDVLQSSEAVHTQELIIPKNIHSVLSSMNADEKRKRTILKGLTKLFKSIISTVKKSKR